MTENEQITHINCGYNLGKAIPAEFLSCFKGKLESLSQTKDKMRWEHFLDGYNLALRERSVRRDKVLKQIREKNGHYRER